MNSTPPQAVAKLRALLTGRALPYTRPGSVSAIAKQPRSGPVAVGPLGLADDEQGDPRVHGGPDKAVHCYAFSQYAPWRQELAGNATAQALLAQPGAFGENFSLDGINESQVCLADQWQVGSARFEVSQGRQPCWKLNLRFGVPDMSARVQNTLRAGWYCRTLQDGVVQAGDALKLLERPHPGWTVQRLLALIRDRECHPAVLNDVLALPLPPDRKSVV